LDGFHDTTALAVHFSWFLPLINSIPQWLVLKMNPGFSSFIDFKKVFLWLNPR
jgi:hypothetical protein